MTKKEHGFVRTIKQIRELITLLEEDLEWDNLNQDTLVTLETLSTLVINFTNIFKPTIQAYILEDECDVSEYIKK